MQGLEVTSKLNADWGFLMHLHQIGRERADRWLEHFPGRSNREGFPRRHESDSRFPLGQGGQS
jgi:NTE family protein